MPAVGRAPRQVSVLAECQFLRPDDGWGRLWISAAVGVPVGDQQSDLIYAFVSRSCELNQRLADLSKQRVAMGACRIKMVRNANEIAIFKGNNGNFDACLLPQFHLELAPVTLG